MMEWQDIESAPRDGTPILLYRPASQSPNSRWATIILAAWVRFDGEDDEVEEGFASPNEPFFDGYSRSVYQEAIDADEHYLINSATHWLPLPPPPKEQPHD